MWNQGFEQSTEEINSDTLSQYSKSMSDWIMELFSRKQELENLTKSTESEFLSIGEKFQNFSAQSEDIAKITLTTVNLLSGSDFKHGIDDLDELLKRITRYLRFSEENISHNTKLLHDILKTLNSVESPLREFEKIIKKLSIVSISTRIESSRLTDSNKSFDTLSNDVKNLSNQIDLKVGNIINKSNQLKKTIKKTLDISIGLQTKQYIQAKEILDSTDACLNSLQEGNTKSTHTIQKISDKSNAIVEYISKIVHSMQFHDIMRQKIEHVVDAINDLSESNEIENDSNETENYQDLTERIMHIGDVCELEHDQLVYTRDEIVTAIEDVIAGIEGISEQINIIVDHIHEILSVSQDDPRSFLKKIETGILQVTSLLSENLKANYEFNLAMTESANMIENMTSFVTDIQQIGYRIGLIALNGLVNAAHLGEEGAALGVLAEGIQDFSGDARQQVSLISDTLKDIIIKSEKLKIGLGSKSDKIDAEHIVEEVVQDLRNLLGTVHDVHDKIENRLEQVESLQQKLLLEIGNHIEKINIHKLFQSVLNKSISTFSDIVTEARSYVPQTDIEQKTKRLNKLKNRYTMHSERVVHESHEQTDADENIDLFTDENIELFTDENIESGNSDPSDEDSFGDNVELF